MKSLIAILMGLFSTWHFSDINSESISYRVLFPIGLYIFIFAFLLWLVFNGGYSGKSDTSGSISSSAGADDSGDCGD